MRSNEIIKKSNTLISSKCKLGINEQKILYKVISKIRVNDVDFKKHKIETSELIKFIGTKSNTIYKDLRQYTHNLLKEVLTIKTDDKIIQTNWFATVEHLKNNNVVIFSFHPVLKPYLLNLKEKFTKFDIDNISNFKSKYSPRIFEILKQYEKIGHRTMSIDYLKEILLIENEYSIYSNFKNKILIPAHKEINKYTDILFDYNEIKQNKKVVDIEFIITSKEKTIEVKKKRYKKKIKDDKKNEINVSNSKVSEIDKKINKITGDNVSTEKIMKWIERDKEDKITHYLSNWDKWNHKDIKNIAGFFVDLVDNDRPLPKGKKGVKKATQETNYQQRKYKDEFFDQFYENLKG